jgi:hypothetical protein
MRNSTNLVFLKFIIAASMFCSCSKNKAPFIYDAYACKNIFQAKIFQVEIELYMFTTLVQNLILSETKYSKKHTSASSDVLESPFTEHNCEKSDAHLTAFLNRPNM